MQPTVTDAMGTLRFKENAIVCWLLDAGPFDMNVIAAREDRRQFAQLLGYSVSGYEELPYVEHPEERR
jgi:hypothetical protein